MTDSRRSRQASARRLALLGLWCISGLVISGLSGNAFSGTFVVVPPGLEDVEGNSSYATSPAPPTGVRWQDVFPASEFSAVPDGSNTIVSMRLRPDFRVRTPHAFAADYELWLSTTDAAPGPTLSNTFSQNRSDDALLVFEGPIRWETDGSSGPWEGPRAFDYVVQFSQPFTYDPREGKNLLVEEVFLAGSTVGPIYGDSHQSPQTRVVVGLTDSALVATLRFNDSAVRQFEFVPSGDFDLDGDVDGDDFLAWQGGFGTLAGAQKSDGDYDNDGDVDGDDFLGWQSEFGSGSGSVSAAVPEPATALMLLGAAVVGLFPRLRRRR